MKGIFFFLFFSLWLAFPQAQEPKFILHDPGKAYKDVPINVMMQDSQSMIWLGTKNGLARYDGNEFIRISVELPDSSNEVTSLFEDKGDTIWVGTSRGNIYYLDKSRNAHLFDAYECCPRKKITAIVQDNMGQIWFATYGEGVYVWNTKRMYLFNDDDPFFKGKDVYSMINTGQGEIWAGTDDGINVCSFDNEHKHIRNLGLKDGLPDQIITALKADKQGNVWIGTHDFGVARFDATSQKISQPFDSRALDEITSFEIFDNQEIWIGTKSSGVWRYNPQFEFVRKIVGLEPDKSFEVSNILSDVEGNIWIAMKDGALWSAFRQFESLVTDIGEIRAAFCDHLGQLWVGTSNGLYRIQVYSSALSKAIRIAPAFNFSVTSIVEDDFNNLWIATLDKGLYIYAPAPGKVMQISSSISKLGSSIMSMDRTKDKIWIATLQGSDKADTINPYAGVFSFPLDIDITKAKKFHFEILSDPWQDRLQYVNQVFVDAKDRVWFATDGNGAYCIDGKKVKQYNVFNNISLKKVFSISEDQKNHMWFNTQDWGLVELIGDSLSPLNVSEGLTNMNNISLAETKNGDILIAHEHGLDLMEPARRHFMYYSSEIGAEGFEPGTNAVAKDSKRNVYIGGLNMIMEYYATNHKFTIDPMTIITRVQVNLKSVDFNTKTVFKHSDNSFAFDYIGLWYTSPRVVNYKYKLSPVDSVFKESKDLSAAYSNLPPGKYTFSVKGSENRGFFTEPTATYSFTITKPFYRELWFIFPMIFFAGLMIYWFVKSRDKRIQRQALLKKEMIESQLQALKAQINPHFLFNSFNTLVTIIDENTRSPEIAIEYVEKLADFFRSILQYREQETITLEEEWDMVQNFAYLLEKRYGSSLRLHLDPPVKDAFILPMTLQMLVENAVKHNVITESKPLDVYITIDTDRYITVKNNLQPKSKNEPSTQFGLQSILKRYQLLSQRKVIIEKNHDTFKVRIPILNKSNE